MNTQGHSGWNGAQQHGWRGLSEMMHTVLWGCSACSPRFGEKVRISAVLAWPPASLHKCWWEPSKISLCVQMVVIKHTRMFSETDVHVLLPLLKYFKIKELMGQFFSPKKLWETVCSPLYCFSFCYKDFSRTLSLELRLKPCSGPFKLQSSVILVFLSASLWYR